MWGLIDIIGISSACIDVESRWRKPTGDDGDDETCWRWEIETFTFSPRRRRPPGLVSRREQNWRAPGANVAHLSSKLTEPYIYAPSVNTRTIYLCPGGEKQLRKVQVTLLKLLERERTRKAEATITRACKLILRLFSFGFGFSFPSHSRT